MAKNPHAALRVCARCKESKPLSEFYVPPRSYCRVCSRRAVLDWRAKYPGRRQAHVEVAHALKSGDLVRPDRCSKCEAWGSPVAHHEDYEKPLDVVWLCDTCHAQRHVELKRSRPRTDQTSS